MLGTIGLVFEGIIMYLSNSDWREQVGPPLDPWILRAIPNEVSVRL